MDVEIDVDRGRCIGAGECVRLAPGVFDQDDGAISFVVDPRGESEERIVHAVVACPMQAITLHVGGVAVGANELRDWAHGAHADDPIVALLEQFCDEHHELRAALAEVPTLEDVDRADAICALTRAHLRNEEHAYSVLTALIDSELVDAFDDIHATIDRDLDEVAASRADGATHGRILRELATLVEDHIRLEETVLFPVALAALARQHAEPEAATVEVG